MIRTRRWDEPALPDDGLRVLITRYRPRGLPKAQETWELWLKELAPSVELHAAAYGKGQPAISFDEYARRYLAEMGTQGRLIESLGRQLKEGGTVTLLCSSACTDPLRCHRTLLSRLVEEAAAG
ncbi:MAG: DUF488 domain-containing protein [Myxococcales bacterium]